VSIVRWNLKKAYGKVLALLTETIYKAATLDKDASCSKVLYLYGNVVVDMEG
jgi:hypothetical protein